MRKRTVLSVACCLAAGLLLLPPAALAAPVRLTANGYHDEYPVVSGPYMAWAAQVDGADYEIVFSDGTSVMQLTNNDYGDFDPRISGNKVVWVAHPESSYEGEIFLFDGTNIVRLTDNDQQDRLPEIHGNLVVWQHEEAGDDQIWYYDGVVKQVAVTVDSLDDMNPQVYGSLIVWHAWDGTDYEIYLHDVSSGVTGQLTNDATDDMFPDISSDLIAWQKWYGATGVEPEVVIHDGVSERRLTNDELKDDPPVVDGNRVVWERGRLYFPSDPYPKDLRQVMYFDGATVRALSGTLENAGHHPRISGQNVVWIAGNRSEAIGVFNGIMSVIRPRMSRRAGDLAVRDTYPDVSGNHMVWTALMGEQFEIYSDTIDSARPVPQAPKAVAVPWGTVARLPYKIVDKGSARAKVIVTIKRGTRTVKKITIASAATNRLGYAAFRVLLPKGIYTFFVSAQDAWGNTSAKAARNSLTVR